MIIIKVWMVHILLGTFHREAIHVLSVWSDMWSDEHATELLHKILFKSLHAHTSLILWVSHIVYVRVCKCDDVTKLE